MDSTSASHSNNQHCALGGHHQLPPDTYRPLFNWFFQDERYVNWSSGKKPWQLHCSGGPGCGKTSLAALVVEDLRDRFNGSPVSVTSIFIQNNILASQAFSEETFLEILYQQLLEYPNEIKLSPYEAPYAQHLDQNDSPNVSKSDTLRNALYCRLSANAVNFLVFDGYDRFDKTTRGRLDLELQKLRNYNTHTFLTRRYQEPPDKEYTCNNCPVPRENISLYWACKRCMYAASLDHELTYDTLCYSCNNPEKKCDKDGHDEFLVEPYPYVDIDVGQVIENDLRDFTVWQLEKEYGDLGLGGDQPVPASRPHKPSVGRKLVKFVMNGALNNINMAKLRLDEIHSMESFDDIDKVRDRIPRSVVAFFDAEVERIEKQYPDQSDLILAVIAIVAEFGEEIFIEELEETLLFEAVGISQLSDVLPNGVHEIISSTNGLISKRKYIEGYAIECWSPFFSIYARESYNDSLIRARTKSRMGQLFDVGTQIQMSEDDCSTPGLTTRSTFSSIRSPSHISPSIQGQDSPYFRRIPFRTLSDDSDGSLRTDWTIDSPKSHDLLHEGRQHHFQGLGLGLGLALPIESPVGGKGAKTMQQMRMCAFCENNVLRSGSSWGYHHNSLERLELAIAEACVFCSNVYTQTKVDKAFGMPLYYWTLRSTGRTVTSSIALTFRSVQYDKNDKEASRNVRKFHFIPEAHLSHIPSVEELGSSTEPNEDYGKQLREWISTCDAMHPNCARRSEESFVPTRLVDLQPGDDNYVRVVETAAHDLQVPYLTLSHSWGRDKFLTLRHDNKDRLMGLPGVAISELNKNFRQAIKVAKFVGMRYIWIDSLCIIQGPGSDFPFEGQLMHKVYRFSYCNIAVTDSKDGEGGVFRERDVTRILPPRLEVDSNEPWLAKGIWRILPEDLWSKDLLSMCMYTRGWVFQERMLSPRLLHFAHDQIFWDCGTLSASETLPHGLPHALDKLSSTDRLWRGRLQASSSRTSDADYFVGSNDGSMEEFWKSSLLNYTSCDLTDQSDKTVAIWSIAKLIRDILDGDEYGGGLWQDQLIEQLAWRRKNCEEYTRLDELQSNNPSWSWASVKGSIIAHDRIAHRRCYVATNHEGEDLSFQIAKSSNRDQEPKLLEWSLPICGTIGRGKVRKTRETGAYSLELCMNVEASPIACDESGRGVIDIFPDEVLPLSDLNPNQCEYVILAASCSEKEHHDDNAECEYVSTTSTSAKAAKITFDGIGLLLIPQAEVKKRQEAKLEALGQGDLDLNPQIWDDKQILNRLSHLHKTIAQIEKSEKIHRGELLYRRIGALNFRNVSAKTWSAMQSGGRVKLRLY